MSCIQSKAPCAYSGEGRPRLLFFRSKYGRTVPHFLVMHRDEHARCLSQFFDLKIIEDDCDYGQVCDDHRPDACLVEIGLLMQDARQPRVTNMGRKNGVPRLALMQADVWGLTRSRIFAEAEALDFDADIFDLHNCRRTFPQVGGSALLLAQLRGRRHLQGLSPAEAGNRLLHRCHCGPVSMAAKSQAGAD